MSDASLLVGAECHLRKALNEGEMRIGIQPSGLPPAKLGGWYVAIDDDGYSNSGTDFLSESYTLSINVYVRMAAIPKDRTGGVLTRMGELRELCRRIILAVHGSYDLMAEANAAIEADMPGANGFVEPLRFRTATAINEVDPSTLGVSGGKTGAYMRRLTFGEAMRYQRLDSEELS